MRDIDFLEETYNKLKAFGVVGTKQQFSVELLGRSGSYLSSMICRSRRPSAGVLEHLRRILTLWIGVFEVTSPHAHEVKLRRQRLKAVLQSVIDHQRTQPSSLRVRDGTR